MQPKLIQTSVDELGLLIIDDYTGYDLNRMALIDYEGPPSENTPAVLSLYPTEVTQQRDLKIGEIFLEIDFETILKPDGGIRISHQSYVGLMLKDRTVKYYHEKTQGWFHRERLNKEYCILRVGWSLYVERDSNEKSPLHDFGYFIVSKYTELVQKNMGKKKC